AEGVCDAEVAQLPVTVLRAHVEAVVAAEEAAVPAEVIEVDAGEIAEDAVLVRALHRERMLRAVPGRELARVAAAARFGADKRRRRARRIVRRLCLLLARGAGQCREQGSESGDVHLEAVSRYGFASS